MSASVRAVLPFLKVSFAVFIIPLLSSYKSALPSKGYSLNSSTSIYFDSGTVLLIAIETASSKILCSITLTISTSSTLLSVGLIRIEHCFCHAVSLSACLFALSKSLNKIVLLTVYAFILILPLNFLRRITACGRFIFFNH